MINEEDLEFVRRLLDEYAKTAWRMSVASDENDERGVPKAMQSTAVDKEGWVEWRMLPSTLHEAEIAAVETEFGIHLPPLFRAYLSARFHLFNQVGSRKYQQQILMSDTPSRNPLKPLHDELSAWRPLIAEGYVPFAEWGDGWGPMCFDDSQRAPDGDCPIVWFEHELLVDLRSEKYERRESVARLAQPLYSSFREFVTDVFVADEASTDCDQQ